MASNRVSLALLALFLLGPGVLHGTFMDTCSDSLLLLPKPLLALEEGRLRYGLQFSVQKTLVHISSRLTPYLETGITLFDKIDASPDDKKHLFLKVGCLWRLGPILLSAESGLLYGNGKLGPTSGLGAWKIFSFGPPVENRTIKDFPSYEAFVKWRNTQQKQQNRLFKGCAVSARLFFDYSIQPALSGGLFFDLFL